MHMLTVSFIAVCTGEPRISCLYLFNCYPQGLLSRLDLDPHLSVSCQRHCVNRQRRCQTITSRPSPLLFVSSPHSSFCSESFTRYSNALLRVHTLPTFSCHLEVQTRYRPPILQRWLWDFLVDAISVTLAKGRVAETARWASCPLGPLCPRFYSAQFNGTCSTWDLCMEHTSRVKSSSRYLATYFSINCESNFWFWASVHSDAFDYKPSYGATFYSAHAHHPHWCRRCSYPDYQSTKAFSWLAAQRGLVCFFYDHITSIFKSHICCS